MFKRISALLLMCSGLAASETSKNPFVLQKVAEPSFQAIQLVLDPAKDDFTGATQIELKLIKPTKKIEISGRDYKISFSQIYGASDCDLEAVHIEEYGKVALSCDKTMPVGNYTLAIQYSALYNRNSVGLYKTVDDGVPYLFTQFEMSDARRAIPGFDEPSYKIPYQMTITSPKGQKVYNNTPVIRTSEVEQGIKYEFAKTKALSSYLIALAVGEFEEIEVKGMSVPGKVITTKGKIELAQYAAKQMPRVLGALEDYFGIKYPYSKLDSVAVPEFPFGAMENAGLVTYREDILLLDEKTANLNSKTRNVSIIAHELAHQWYGNLVTMAWWNDLWLNEAFASWMATKIAHQLNPEFELDLQLSKNRAMGQDAKVYTKPIRKPIRSEDDIMDGLGLAYSKGEAVLSMIENWIGEKVFKNGMRAYMREHAYKNTQASDLWDSLSKASGKDVGKVLESFIIQSSYPLVSFNVQGKNLSIKQRRFLIAGTTAKEQQWKFPLTIKYGVGKRVDTLSTLIDKKSQTVSLKYQPEWIYPDENAMGYYRWLLEDKYFDGLLNQGKEHLTPRERKSLIASVDALFDAGLVSAADLLKTLGQFISDPHPSIVSYTLGYIQGQKSTFIDASNQDNWSKFIAESVRPAIDKYGLEPKKGEDAAISKLRPRLLNLAATEANNPDVINIAKMSSELYLRGKEISDPYSIGTFLSIAVLNGDKKFLDSVKKEYEITKNPIKKSRLLYAMSFAPTNELQKEVLSYSLTEAVKAPDLGSIFAGQTFQNQREQFFYEWVYENFDALKNKLPPFQVAYLPYFVANGCSAEQFQKAEIFFNKNFADNEAVQRSLSKVKANTLECLAKREREQHSINQFLSSYN